MKLVLASSPTTSLQESLLARFYFIPKVDPYICKLIYIGFLLAYRSEHRDFEDMEVRGLGDPKLNTRQDKILKLVRELGYVSIDKLSAQFGVSQQTIRRDIISLDSQNLVLRHHGGAGVRPGADRLAYPNRKGRNALWYFKKSERRRMPFRVRRID